MESLYFLIPLSMLVCLGGVILFFWAVKSGQYDDLDAESERLLFDDEYDIHKGEDREKSQHQEVPDAEQHDS